MPSCKTNKFHLLDSDQCFKLYQQLKAKISPEFAMMANILHLSLNGYFWKDVQEKFYLYRNDENGEHNDPNPFVVCTQAINLHSKYAVIILAPNKPTIEMLTAFEQLLNWDEVLLFHTIPEEFFPYVEEILSRNYSGQITKYTGIFYSFATKNSHKLNSIQIPENTFINTLTVQDVPTIVSSWKFAEKHTVEQLSACLSHLKSITVCTTDKDCDNEQKILKSWGLVSPIGSINLLRTSENFRNQGLGALTVSELTKKKLEVGLMPIGEIETFNETAGRLLSKVGYEKCHNTVWVYLNRDGK